MSVPSRESVENEKEIPIPMSERVKISDLKFDQDNPNRLTLMQLDRLKDSAEYLRIIGEGEKEELKLFLQSVGEKLPLEVDDREVSFSVPETYELIIECRSEAQQKEYFEKLKSEGYRLRILTL